MNSVSSTTEIATIIIVYEGYDNGSLILYKSF